MSWAIFAAVIAAGIFAVPLTRVDIREHRLPNPLTIALTLISAVFVLLDSYLTQSFSSLLPALLSAVITFGLGYAMAYWNLIGMGDVKLLVGLHLILGYLNPWLILISLTASFVAATLVALPRLALGKITVKSSTPMGPFLLLGFFLTAILWATVAV